jgi:diadenosine tetraphosphate (Ap4A) HIT family hydrolase
MKEERCVICSRHARGASGLEVFKGLGLIVRHYPIEDGISVCSGYLVLEMKRHVTAFSALTGEEAAELGTIMAKAAGLIERKLNAEHIYAFRIGDVAPHMHIHLVPRYPDTPHEFWGTNIRSFTKGPRVNADQLKVLVADLQQSLAQA